MASSRPRLHFTPGKDPVPVLQEAGRTPAPVWTSGKSRPHRDSITDRKMTCFQDDCEKSVPTEGETDLCAHVLNLLPQQTAVDYVHVDIKDVSPTCFDTSILSAGNKICQVSNQLPVLSCYLEVWEVWVV